MVATLLLFAVPLAMMAAIPEQDVLGTFSLIIDLTGDIPTGFCAFMLPALLYIRLFDGERDWMWYSAFPVVALGFVLMFVCPVVDLVEFTEACRSSGGCSSY